MKAKALVVLVLAGVWVLGSWWWYTCKIKGFCGAPVAHAEQAPDTHSTLASTTSNTNDAAKTTDTPLTDTQLAAVSTPPSILEATTASDSQTEKVAEPPALAQVEETQPTTLAKEEPVATDPSASAEPVTTNLDDSDKDGVPNELEKKLGLDPYMADSDKDGVSDKDELGARAAEAPLDTDDDGIINALDTDDDGDGDLTANEAVDPNNDQSVADARDSDQDGTPDYLDKDSGWATLDDDNDGILNGEEKEAGTNPTLTDSDGDGVPDSIELVDKKDTDEDGILDALDTDDDNDGIMTAMENPDPNNDGDLKDAADHNKNGTPDYLEANSSGEVLAQSSLSTAEPSPKDPDMAIGKSTQKPAEADTKAQAATTEAVEPSTSETAVKTAETEPKAKEEEPEAKAIQQKSATKADDTNKITVDLDKPTADKKNVGSARLYFPFRSSKPELADSTAEYFDDLISFLKANPKATVKVIGHTDNVGDADVNEKLGLQRAERIRSQLIKRGAPAARVEASSKGEAAPWVSNKTEEGRNKNRRVEVKPIK